MRWGSERREGPFINLEVAVASGPEERWKHSRRSPPLACPPPQPLSPLSFFSSFYLRHFPLFSFQFPPPRGLRVNIIVRGGGEVIKGKEGEQLGA